MESIEAGQTGSVDQIEPNGEAVTGITTHELHETMGMEGRELLDVSFAAIAIACETVFELSLTPGSKEAVRGRLAAVAEEGKLGERFPGVFEQFPSDPELVRRILKTYAEGF